MRAREKKGLEAQTPLPACVFETHTQPQDPRRPTYTVVTYLLRGTLAFVRGRKATDTTDLSQEMEDGAIPLMYIL